MKTRLSICLCALAGAIFAATSTVWEVNGFGDLIKGRMKNLSLSADGRLAPGPVVRWNSALGQPALWSIAAAPDGSFFAATGHSGKVYRVKADGTFAQIWSAEQSEVFAVTCDAQGVLYAGTSPSGGVYRIDGTNVREVWRASGKYIWALQFAADGGLFIATGEPGRVYRLAPGAATPELYYDPGQSNVTAMALAPNGHVLAGTDPNGLLYDISARNKAEILYDSGLPEIRALAVNSKGYVYVAAMGGALSTRTGGGTTSTAASSSPVIATSATVVTVSEAAENEQSGVKVTTDQSRASGAQTSGTSTSSVTEVSGVEKSAIYRISPDRQVETLRSSKEENIYDLLLDGDDIVFSSDQDGRIYRWHDQRTILLAEPGTGETTRLFKKGDNLFAAMSNPARFISLGSAGSAAAWYESPVHDSVSVARWGHLQWHGAGYGLKFQTRTGNTARPDATWSNWSDAITDGSDSLIKSPVARFIQWRAEWPVGSGASLSTVDVPFLPKNGTPVIRSITVTSVVGSNPTKAGNNAPSSSTAAYSITVTDTGESSAASSASSATQSLSRLQSSQTQISWQADDPDGDKLAFSLQFRAEEESNWHTIRTRMSENTLLLDPDVLADGRYYFRVTASDAPANAPEYARQTELVSSPVLIDNTPPVVTLGAPLRNEKVLDVDIDGNDKTSPLRLCEYALDGGFWQPIEAVDGVTDSPHERFHLHVENLAAGEHLLVVRVYDMANNAGLARVVVK